MASAIFRIRQHGLIRPGCEVSTYDDARLLALLNEPFVLRIFYFYIRGVNSNESRVLC